MDGDLHARLKSRASGIGVGVFAAPAGAIAEAVGQLASAQVLHFDVMDGVWVPQVTGGPAFVAAFAGRYLCDVHLMVADPAAQVAAFLARAPGWSEERRLSLTPLDGGDGFFLSVMRRLDG